MGHPFKEEDYSYDFDVVKSGIYRTVAESDKGTCPTYQKYGTLIVFTRKGLLGFQLYKPDSEGQLYCRDIIHGIPKTWFTLK